MEFPIPMPTPFPSLNSKPIATLLLLLFISFYYLWRKWELKRGGVSERKLQAPSPLGAFPIIGHLHLLHNSKLPHRTLGAMADKYGPIFRVQLGSRSALVVSNWEMAKESMCTNDAAAASCPELSVSKHFSYDFAMFGLGCVLTALTGATCVK